MADGVDEKSLARFYQVESFCPELLAVKFKLLKKERSCFPERTRDVEHRFSRRADPPVAARAASVSTH